MTAPAIARYVDPATRVGVKLTQTGVRRFELSSVGPVRLAPSDTIVTGCNVGKARHIARKAAIRLQREYARTNRPGGSRSWVSGFSNRRKKSSPVDNRHGRPILSIRRSVTGKKVTR